MRSHIEACQAGSQTVQHYCTEHGIKKSVYYYWSKRLQKQSEPTGFVPLSINNVERCDVVVNFPNGVRISFNGSISASVLKELACCI